MKKKKFYLLGVLTLLLMHSCVLSDVEKSIRIEGQVLDYFDNEVAGVDVSVRKKGEALATAITDAQGRYRLEYEGSGTAILTFQKTGYAKLDTTSAFIGGSVSSFPACIYTYQQELDAAIKTPFQNRFYASASSLNVSVNSKFAWTPTAEVDWITASRDGSRLVVTCVNNPLTEERSGKVTIEGQDGAKRTLEFTQAAGPALMLVDFTGKDGQSNIDDDGAFLKYNRRVVVISPKHCIWDLNDMKDEITTFPVRYEDNQQTVIFPEVSLEGCSRYEIEFTVRNLEDGYEYRDTLKLK